MRLLCLLMFGWLLGGSSSVAATNSLAAASDRIWAQQVQPLLKERCSECHSAFKRKGGLDLTDLSTILRGGDRGSAALPGRPEESNLYKVLLEDGDPVMPPGKRKRLSDEEVGWIKNWILHIPVAPPSTEDPASAHAPSGLIQVRPKLDWAPRPGMTPSDVVDGFLKASWKRDGVAASRDSTDAQFLRRVSLDLIGRVPTPDELRTLTDDKSREKRAARINVLLQGAENARHMREVFDTVLMSRRGSEWEDSRSKHKWFGYLESAFRDNRPWDQVVRELIVARPADVQSEGASWFLYERQNNAQAMAEAVAPVVYGVQIKCAQCHDHMVAREIKQAHYWGMAAAFMRSKNAETPEGPRVGESAIGGFVSFANLKKESQPARLVFFNQREISEARPKEGEKESDDPSLYVVAPPKEKEKGKPKIATVPKFSRREAFAETVVKDNPLLARAFVNRVWAMLFGRGIVHPPDLMDSKHPPSHPELLDWLAADFESSGYNVRRLIQTLCNTKAYQLSSQAQPESDSRKKTAATPSSPALAEVDQFARFVPKPLSGEQIYRSLARVLAGNPTGDELSESAAGMELRRAFVKEFPDLFAPEPQSSLQQAMFLSNSPKLSKLLEGAQGSLILRMESEPQFPDRARMAFKAVLHRLPDKEELKACVEYLKDRPGMSGNRQLVWSLITGPEFLLNH